MSVVHGSGGGAEGQGDVEDRPPKLRMPTVPFKLNQGHRQLVCRPACEPRLSRVGGRDDDTCLPELCRLPLPG